MFTNRIRNGALLLAGAAIVATTLFTPVAAAAGIPAASSAATELREFDPSKMPKIPVADVKVDPVSAIEINGHVIYKFRVTNLGPDAARITFEGRAVYFETGLAQPEDVVSNHDMVLKSGQDQVWAFGCPPVENSACWRAYFTARPVGIDKNFDNNSAYLNAP